MLECRPDAAPPATGVLSASAAGQVGALFLQARDQRRAASAREQSPEVRTLDRHPADRPIRQHVDCPPTPTLVSHYVVELVRIAGGWDNSRFHHLVAVRQTSGLRLNL